MNKMNIANTKKFIDRRNDYRELIKYGTLTKSKIIK